MLDLSGLNAFAPNFFFGRDLRGQSSVSSGASRTGAAHRSDAQRGRAESMQVGTCLAAVCAQTVSSLDFLRVGGPSCHSWNHEVAAFLLEDPDSFQCFFQMYSW